MDSTTRFTALHGAYSRDACYAPASTTTSTPSPPTSCSFLVEDFEVSYVRTVIEDAPLQLSSYRTEGTVSSCIKVADDFSEDGDLSEATEEPESGNQSRVKITLTPTASLQDLGSVQCGKKDRPSIVDDSYWDEHDPTKKWHFEAKAYSRVINGKEHFYCQLCEDDGNVHQSFKRREMERHLRRLDHLPPELFCKEAKAVCPCPKNRAFTRIDGRKRHIKISIEHAKKDAQSRRADDEVEKWQKRLKLLETTRGR